MDRGVRAFSVAGVLLVLLAGLIHDFPLHRGQGALFAVLAAVGFAAALVLFRLLPREKERLRTRPALLVPLGLLVLAQSLFSWAEEIPFLGTLLGADLPVPFFRGSLLFLLEVGAAVLYASWTTLLVLREARGEEVSPAADLPRAWAAFPRVLGLQCVGWGAILVSSAVLLALLGGIPFLLYPILGWVAVSWNLFTAALLPYGIDGGGRFADALGHGTRVGWERRGRWWKPVVAQLLVLGMVTIAAATVRSHGSYAHSSNWGVNAFWTGGYESETRWLPAWAGVLEAETPDTVTTLLALLLGVLAVAVKLHVAGRLHEDGVLPAPVPPPAAPAPPPPSFPSHLPPTPP
jgi:hypothetical protein